MLSLALFTDLLHMEEGILNEIEFSICYNVRM